ncbi:MAG: hypothetical protein IKY64_08510 [Bacteroidaceae bacterium]|nr:hypothetical protein [Bacteroidaceae bacterium]
MKTKLLFCLMAILWCIVSCNENDVTNDIDGGSSYYYGFPCHAHNLLTVVSEIPFESSGYDIEKIVGGEVKTAEFAISLITYDSLDVEVPRFYEETEAHDVGFWVFQTVERDGISEVEEAIDTYNSRTRVVNTSIQYRFEGVDSLSIIATQDFNGIAAGKELAHCFHIVRYSPPFIFSYKTYELSVYDEWRTDDIADWLAMKPLAQPGMTLTLKEGAYCTANNIAFTVTMTLTNGKVLTATTPAVSIVM